MRFGRKNLPLAYAASNDANDLVVFAARLSALIAILQADHAPAHQYAIYRRFDSEALG